MSKARTAKKILKLLVFIGGGFIGFFYCLSYFLWSLITGDVKGMIGYGIGWIVSLLIFVAYYAKSSVKYRNS